MPTGHLDLSGVDFVQLPPVRSDGASFTRLLDSDGNPASCGIHAGRAVRMLEDTLRNNPPDVLITELFPFGRRVLRDEFEAALAAVKAMMPAPLVFSSIRDILAPPSNAKKAEQTEAWLAEHYDGVLVHSDAGVVPLGGKLAGDAANRADAPLHRLHRPSDAGRGPGRNRKAQARSSSPQAAVRSGASCSRRRSKLPGSAATAGGCSSEAAMRPPSAPG